jgi:hypothetical protein
MCSVKTDFIENLPAFLPSDFFSLECNVAYAKKGKASLKKMEKEWFPDMSFLHDEENFADIGLMWTEEGIFGKVETKQPFEESRYPNVKEADSIELFFDMRNIKTAGFATRFCHHIVILPAACQGIQCKEMTHFRSEDKHSVKEHFPAEVDVDFGKKGYALQFFLPKEEFYGYDPQGSPSLGFTYRINRPNKSSQHFSVSSLYYSIEQQPSLWATLHLKR